MIDTITYAFPNNTTSSRDFFKYLSLILQTLPNSNMDDDKIVLAAVSPSASLPVTVFEQRNVAFPQMHIGSDPELRLAMGGFTINTDNVSSGVSQTQDTTSNTTRLTIKELHEKLHGHLVRIDHTGINLPTTLVSQAQWRAFVDRIASQSNLYKYPTGEPWLFILPATKAEFEADVTTFPAGREPKCELVYDSYNQVPVIQIDIETDLTRKQVEVLFPDPYGISFPELADYFRTVYVQQEWSGLEVRFDIRFRSDKPGPWETGEWLVKDGGRIK